MIIIDGTEFDVPIIGLDETCDFLDKFAERTEDGKLHRELIGCYFNQQIQFGSPVDEAGVEALMALWNKLTEPVEFHTVTVPDVSGVDFTFTAYFSNVRRSLRNWKIDKTLWKSMTANFIAEQPARDSMITYPIIQFHLQSGILEFSRLEVLDAELVEEVSLLSLDLSINTINFKIKTEIFSMFSETVLEERTPIVVYEVVDGVSVLIGKFYLDKWKNVAEQITEFSAIDIIGVLDSTDFDGAFLETDTLVSSLLEGILVPINVSYSLDASFSATTLKGYIPPGNYRKALIQIGFAISATIATSRSEILSIIPAPIPNLTYDYRVHPSQKISGQFEIEKQALISYIELVSHNYTKQTTAETFFDKYLEAGSYKIVYDQPYTDITITGPGYIQTTTGTEGGDEIGTENGDQIEASGEFVTGSNSTYLTITTAGQVTFTGYPWLDSKRSFTVSDPTVTNKNSVVISDATLISNDNAQAVLDVVADYYAQRYKQKIKILPSAIEAGDIILSSTIYNTYILGCVENSVTNLCEGFMLKLTIRGHISVFVPDAEDPTRNARTGIAISGVGLSRNNKHRKYA